MAYAALVSLAQPSNQILNHDHHHPLTLPENQEIISIRNHAVVLQSFLDDIPEKASSLKERIREVANEAEDVIEYLLWGNDPSEVEFERQLRNAEEKITSIGGEVMDYLKRNGFVNNLGRRGDYRHAASSSQGRDVVVGFAGELLEIKSQLCGESSKLLVLPIVGIGGIGKTTLARSVYDDEKVISHFDIRSWVTISQDYSVGSILLNLLASMKGKEIEPERDLPDQVIPQGEEIGRYIWNRSYLIVIDGMRSKKDWDEIKMLFPDNRRGSRIVLTTRLLDVATYPDPCSPVHMMHLLSDDQSWHLLKEKVFADEDCPLELEESGKKIVKSCGGLPLSIVVMAGLLSNIDKTLAFWEQIAENDGELEKIISLSYTHLPHHLRACLLYMGGFPEDYEIRVSEFIKLWLAEGFLRYPNNGCKSLEDVAEECVDNLVNRSLVLASSRKFDGKIKSCSLHDMVRDFCIRQVEQEKLLHPVTDYLPSPILRKHFLPRVLENHCRISATSYDLDLKDSMHGSRIRTIICNPKKGYRSSGSVQNFSLLRVLHVLRSNDDTREWEPGQVFDLIYLTYLSSNIPTSIVPPAISKLHSLHTLIIYRYEVHLPVEIWRMRPLKHLIAFSFHHLPHPEEEAAFPLENLQTLCLVKNLVCSERIMEMIPNVEKLGICCSEKKFGEGYHLENLKHLQQLEKLKLKLETCGCLSLRPSAKPVYPLSLKKLTLSGWRFPWRDMRIVGSLPNIQVLKLRNHAFDGNCWETTEVVFPRLRVLLIDESNLRIWKSKRRQFPVLEGLMLYRCPYLFEIPSDIGHIATLKLIEVDHQKTSLFYSAKRIERDRQSGKHSLKDHTDVAKPAFSLSNEGDVNSDIYVKATNGAEETPKLVGRRSSILKVKPTPPPYEVTSMKHTRAAPRSGALKRKVFMDDTMVLHGDAIRQQLTITEDIRHVRKKAPRTLFEISMIQKQHMDDETFIETVFTVLQSLMLLPGICWNLSEHVP
ncbi:hypothetical protein C2S51_014776 [Perilla frutescens var. frutescens]|nr:hypothetical protein C2S51_014776 [Perilla frutescens var. frutescens]